MTINAGEASLAHPPFVYLLLCGLVPNRPSLVAQTVKASAYNVGDPGSIPVLGRSPGELTGNLLHDSCLGNPMDRGTFKDKQSMLFCRKEGKLDLHKNKQHLMLDKLF